MWDILRCVTAHDTRITNCISQFEVKKEFLQQLQHFHIYRKVYTLSWAQIRSRYMRASASLFFSVLLAESISREIVWRDVANYENKVSCLQLAKYVFPGTYDTYFQVIIKPYVVFWRTCWLCMSKGVES